MYSIIDIEGDGAPYRKESIIEIAIYRYDGHQIVDQFSSLVKPPSSITPFVQRLTGISDKMVLTAPKFHELAKRVVEITANTILVGHNIDFDYRMLRQEFKRLGYDYKINTIDTIPLAKKLIPEAPSYNLGKLVKSLGIPLTNQHRAAGDAKATVELFKLLITKDKDSEIIQQHHDQTNAKTYINKIRNLTQDLPAEKGIIYFQDQKGKIILSDFVNDINKAAKSIFHSKAKHWQKVQQDTRLINYDLVGSAVLAKLLMKTKGIKKKENLPYGLYHNDGKYIVDKITKLQDQKPFVKFSSLSQGKKAINFINQNPDLQQPKFLKKLISIPKTDQLWLSTGRVLGERSFLIFENGKLTGYGFYEIYKQIESLKKLNALKIIIDYSTADVQNDLKLALLRGDFTIVELPKK